MELLTDGVGGVISAGVGLDGLVRSDINFAFTLLFLSYVKS